jgi:hypothetical protein
MSDLASGYYGDYGMAEATARKRRNMESVANRQAATLGQMRGTRKLSDLTRALTEGFRPTMAGYGRRGLAGPKVASGIQRSGLERYVADMQTQLGDYTQQLQDEANLAVQQEAAAQAALDDYLQQLALQKKQNIIDSATALKQYASY